MFASVVRLYRALQRPGVTQNVFEYAGEVDAVIIALIEDVRALPPKYGVLERYSLNGNRADLEFSLPASEHGRFHQTMGSFISSSPSLEWGELSDNFYLLDLDFFPSDAVVPLPVQRLQEYCEFIMLLSKLATDGPVPKVAGNVNRLLFVLAADTKSPPKTLSIAAKITEKMLSTPLPHLNLLRALLSEERKNQIHVEERRSLMRLAIADLVNGLGDAGSPFESLALNWITVLSTYRHNVLVFLNQFSFEKIRKEIATAQIEYATKLSAVLGDVAGKLLALPISFAGLILLRNATEFGDFAIYSLGLLVVSTTILGILLNQWMQIRRLRDSFEIVFSQYDEKLPSKLKAPIEKAKNSLADQRFTLVITFIVFAALALIPLISVVWFWYSKFLCHPFEALFAETSAVVGF